MVWTERLSQTELSDTSLASQISRILTECILEGAIGGGERLVEAELQRRFRVSRSPIREALRDLEKKGLVEIVPRKGTFVRIITAADIREHFPVRAVLEGLAARHSLGRLSPKALKAMEGCLEGMRRAVSANDTKSYWEHHRSFHDLFIEACGNQLLIGMLKNLRTHALWYRFSYRYYQEDLSRSLGVHEEIMEIFREGTTGRGEELERKVRSHIEEAMESFLDYLEKHPTRGEGKSFEA